MSEGEGDAKLGEPDRHAQLVSLEQLGAVNGQASLEEVNQQAEPVPLEEPNQDKQAEPVPLEEPNQDKQAEPVPSEEPSQQAELDVGEEAKLVKPFVEGTADSGPNQTEQQVPEPEVERQRHGNGDAPDIISSERDEL